MHLEDHTMPRSLQRRLNISKCKATNVRKRPHNSLLDILRTPCRADGFAVRRCGRGEVGQHCGDARLHGRIFLAQVQNGEKNLDAAGLHARHYDSGVRGDIRPAYPVEEVHGVAHD